MTTETHDAKEDYGHFAEYIEERFKEVYRDDQTSDRIDALNLGDMCFDYMPNHIKFHFEESKGRGFWRYDVDATLVAYDNKNGTTWFCVYDAEYTEDER